MNTNRIEVGRRAILAIFIGSDPDKCRLVTDIVERDHGTFYEMKEHGVFSDAQVFIDSLEAISWLRSAIEEEIGHQACRTHLMIQRRHEIAALWQRSYAMANSSPGAFESLLNPPPA